MTEEQRFIKLYKENQFWRIVVTDKHAREALEEWFKLIGEPMAEQLRSQGHEV